MFVAVNDLTERTASLRYFQNVGHGLTKIWMDVVKEMMTTAGTAESK